MFGDMLKKRIMYGMMSAGLLLASCTEGPLPTGAGDVPAEDVSSKLIFTSEHAVPGRLLVYFSEEAVRDVESSALTKSGVRTRSGLPDVDAVLEEIGASSVRRLFPYAGKDEGRTRAAGLHRWYVLEFGEEVDLDGAALALAGCGEVSGVEFNRRLKRADSFKAVRAGAPSAAQSAESPAFNDPYLPSQWHYDNTGDTGVYPGIRAGADANCAAAWRLCTGDPRVVVAVVDDCVQWDHPDLAANMWTNEAELNGAEGVDDDGNGFVDDIHGYNFAGDGPLAVSSPTEDGEPSHGTHVAGTVAAVNNNGEGVSGVAGGSGSGDGVRIMSCQIFYAQNGADVQGSGTAETSARAIKYAADNGACILQCSYGYEAGAITSDEAYASGASAEKQAIDYFIDTRNCDAVDGGIVLYAAGNEGTAMSSYPGAYRDVISVTAMSCDYTPAYYTNYGPGCNISAPGGDMTQAAQAGVLSTVLEGGYAYMQGTSMACPHVSGVAALGLSYALQQGKTFTRDEFNSILLSSVGNINRYCTGTDSRYSGLMGTGYIDAFQVLMNVRGSTCIRVPVGEQAQVSVLDYIGDGGSQMTVSGVEISGEDRARLGITSDPVVFAGRVLFTCTRTGSGIMTVTLMGGTGNGSGMSGMTVKKEFGLVARGSGAGNGGWL